MNKLYHYMAVLLLAGTATACTDGFQAINDNPNAPTSASVALLLNPQIRTLVQSQFQYDTGATLAHQVAKTNYNDVAQYNFGASEGTWNTFYNSLANVQELIGVAQRDGLPSSEAIGYILKAFCASQLTDHWGDVPYTEASDGGENIHPKYDRQQDIYTGEEGIIRLLEKADRLLAEHADALPADIVYGGDRTRWRKLANSLRLRYLLRISNRKDGLQGLDWQAQLADCAGKPLIESNDDNFALPYLDATPNRCPVFDLRSGEFDYLRMSKELAEVMNATFDPRREVWFQPTARSVEAGAPVYTGIPNGCSSTTLTALGYNQSEVSMLGTLYRNTPDAARAVLVNAAEVKFLLAEAVVRGWLSGDAAGLYRQGIACSLEQYGIGSGPAAAYQQQAGVAYDAAQGLEQVLTQKWLANFMVGYEGWFDFLRTGLPRQTLPIDNRNPTAPGEVPSRFYYPETEQAVNKAQYDAAVSLQGGKDDINTALWWEGE